MAYQTTARQNWWSLAGSGIVAILFGLAALLWPGLTLFVLVMLFAIYAIVAGILEFVAMFRAMGAGTTWWTHLVLGIVGVAAGVIAFAWPGITTFALLYIIAVWAIVQGVVEIAGSFTTGRFLLAVAGLISILFGFVLLANPLAGALALVLVIGVFAIVRGIVLLVEAVRAPAAPAMR
ncbi:MAG: HdeD family acid-resistance protein [Chloroflexota bacterium]|nr:MAG: HdeD family acid-resistance protein [Chloroflexota bacterium]